ncbi:MAG: hypothetical protein Q9160_005121 [Pyrenula sp. 1 TL-2023]
MPQAPGHNRPHSNIGTQDITAATALSQSNSTAAHFLGTHQKPWMNGTALPVSLRVKNGASQADDDCLPQYVSANSPGTTTETQQAESAATTSPEPILSPSLADCSETILEELHTLSPTLPSPAPTDDLGEISAFNQAQHSAISSSLVDEPHSADTITISPTPSNARTNSAIAQEVDTPASPTAGEQEHLSLRSPEARKRSTDDGLAEWAKRSRISAASSTPSIDIGQSRQSQPSTALHSPLRYNFNHQVLDIRLANQTARIRDFIVFKHHSPPPLNTLDQQRCKLLEDACSSNDIFYVCLHKICCSAYVAELTGYPAQNLETDHLDGVRKLEILIKPNSELSYDALAFFAEFPPSLDENRSEVHRRIFESVRVFLHRLSTGWDRHRQSCEERGFPLFVDEMVVLFQLNSVLLQSIVFRSMHRHITKPEDHDLNLRVEKLLEADQKAYSQRQPRPHVLSPQQLRIETHRLGQRYQQIVRARAIEKQRLVGQMTNNVPSTFSTGAGENFSFRSVPAFSETYSSPQPHPSLNSYGQAMRSASLQGLSNVQRSPRPTPYVRSYSVNQGYPGNVPMMVSPQYQINPAIALTPIQVDPRHFVCAGNQRIPTALNQPHYRHSTFLPTPGRSQVTAPLNAIPNASTSPLPFSIRSSFNGPAPPPSPRITRVPQADVRISRFQKLDRNGVKDAGLRLYQYFDRLKTQVKHLGNKQVSFTIGFEIPKDEWERKVSDVLASPGDTGRTRMYAHGKLLFRLRCIKFPQQTHQVVENEWVIQAQCWPKTCLVEINGYHPEIPRKDSHGKDLPLDLTPYVTPGHNSVEFSLIRDAEESTGGSKSYAIAVETVAVSDDKGVRDQVARLEKETSLKLMTKALQPKDDDEELVIIDPDLSVDVVDPFSATMFNIPARGIRCLHRECFDLDNFLQTRKSSRTGAPSAADEWKCPICGTDTRPSQLVIDGFLQHVRGELEESGGLGAKAILIHANGDWEVKAEGYSERPQAEMEAESLVNPGEVDNADKDIEPAVVIDLEDD